MLHRLNPIRSFAARLALLLATGSCINVGASPALAQSNLCSQADGSPLVLGRLAIGNTGDATTDWPPTSACRIGEHDQWWSFVPLTSGDYTFTTRLFGQTDTVMSVYGSCDASVLALACADNVGGPQSQLTLALSAGQRYYISVAKAFDSTDGPFVLQVSPALGSCCIGINCIDLTQDACAFAGGGVGRCRLGLPGHGRLQRSIRVARRLHRQPDGARHRVVRNSCPWSPLCSQRARHARHPSHFRRRLGRHAYPHARRRRPANHPRHHPPPPSRHRRNRLEQRPHRRVHLR